MGELSNFAKMLIKNYHFRDFESLSKDDAMKNNELVSRDQFISITKSLGCASRLAKLDCLTNSA